MSEGVVSHSGRSQANLNEYFRLYQAQDGLCFYCQCALALPDPGNSTSTLPPDRITREHLIPRAKGGTGRRENIVAACCACNHERGSEIAWVDFLAQKLEAAWRPQ